MKSILQVSMAMIVVIVSAACLCPPSWAITDVANELWKEESSNDVNVIELTKLEEPIMLDVLELKDMDILDVLKLISQKSGLNIIAGQNVRGKVTVFLKNIDVRDALRIIVESYGWGYVEKDGVMQVMTDKEFESKFGHSFGKKLETRIQQLSYAKSSDVAEVLNQMKSDAGKVIIDKNSGILILTDEGEKLDAMDSIIRRLDIPVMSEVFVLHYASAESISSKISEMMTPSVGKVNYDERLNRIIVTDTDTKLKEVKKFINAFDHKDREVLIEAKILQITLSNDFKLGIDWEGVVTDYHNLTLAGDFDVLGSSDKSGTVGIGTLASDRYTALVEALETVGKTNILSSPRIMTVNNKEAKILVGSTEPYVTTTTTTPSAGPTTTAESVNFIDVGVKLFVTPTIHEDDFITMKIRPEVSSVTSNLVTSNNNTIPIVETSEAETTVNVKDGVSVIIGGLIKDETINTTNRVPFFGNIPLLGAAFRSTNNSTEKTEIVIFLTPEIVTGDETAVDQLVSF